MKNIQNQDIQMMKKRIIEDEIEIRWLKAMYDKYKLNISNTFVLTGNINDYVLDSSLGLGNIEEYLYLYLGNKFGMKNIYYYDKSVELETIKGLDINQLIHEKEKEDSSLDIDSFKYINDMMKRELTNSVLIVRYPEILIKNNMLHLDEVESNYLIMLHKNINSYKFNQDNNIIIFIADNIRDLNPMLTSSNSNLTEINITLPNYEERLNFIKYILEINDYSEVKFNISLESLSNISAGLNYKSIEDILLLAKGEGVLTDDMALNRKKELIETQYGEIIEIMETKNRSLSNFAGQENIKDYFKEVVIDAVRDQNLSIVPKGILLMGPPGTGKTYFTQCLAGDAGMNSVEFKMSKIKDKWVGQSEKNLEKAFSVFRALSPVIVFIDELDQALGRGSEDGHEVDKGLFGMFLSELSKKENRGKIIWVGATNYPNQIDEALKRSGRFDKKIPFFAPNEEERYEVLKVHLKASSLSFNGDIKDTLKYASEATNGYTQAELEGVIIKAQELALRSGDNYLSDKYIKQALDYMIFASNSKIKEMEDIALRECNDAEFIPNKYKKRHIELLNE